MSIVTDFLDLLQRQRDFVLKVVLLLFMVSAFSTAGYSQKYQVQQTLIPENLAEMNKGQNKNASIMRLFSAIEGTYQVQCFVADYKILLSEELYNKIKGNRKQDVDSYVELDKNSRLFLPSENEINKKDFNRLSNSIYITK